MDIMRKKVVFFSIFTILFISMIILWCYLRKSYQQNFEKLEDKRFMFYEGPYLRFYYDIYECPKSFNSLIDSMKLSQSDYQSFLEQFFMDYLARGDDTLVEYYPIYNRKNKKRESFVLLSAGIDGSHNNVINPEDTLFIDNWTTKIKAYNPETYEKTGDTIRNYKPNFNIYDYFFGNKDLIIQYVDCVQRFKNRVRGTYNADELIRWVEEDDVRAIQQKVIKFDAIIQEDSVSNIDNERYLICKQGDYIIQISMASNDNQESYIGDSILVIGKVSEIDKKNKKIILENCFKVKR